MTLDVLVTFSDTIPKAQSMTARINNLDLLKLNACAP